jgi:hypothetical protein
MITRYTGGGPLATSPRSPWLEFAADAYLDERHRNWALAEELGDVIYVCARGVVLVHRERAEHIARVLGPPREGARLVQPVLLSAPEPVRLPAPPAPASASERQPLVASTGFSRHRDMLGWLGISAGAAVFVAALAVPLDDAALVMALALAVRGGRVIRDPGTLSVTVPAAQRGQEEHHAHRPGGR